MDPGEDVRHDDEAASRFAAKDDHGRFDFYRS
jgi:hypothetical protein